MKIFETGKIFFLICGLTLLAPGLLRADDDEGDDDDDQNHINVAIQGPVEAANCTATPPTLQILGLKIDVSKLVEQNQGGQSNQGNQDDQGDDHEDSATSIQPRDHGDDHEGGGNEVLCSSLVGQTIRLDLAGDQPPLVATKGHRANGYNAHQIFVRGPIQAIDLTGQTITVLGLTISVVTSNGNAAPTPLVDLTTLMVGQEVTVYLQSAHAPFVASAIIVCRQENEIELILDGGDDEEDGNCECHVDEMTVGGTSTGASKAGGKGKKKSLLTPKHGSKTIYHFSKKLKGTKGQLSLKGMPAGKAAISIQRGGKVIGRKTVTIKPHSQQKVVLHVRSSKHTRPSKPAKSGK
jgi:hypothetical protein